MSKKSNLYPP